ncbi:hypothetical protein EX30DRAFT_267491 [Ascodesmis nigricans]|uniref:Uncharacterized protein n=1 Tax=Ascodesmis nigricans TaxID=341454 RepID=A0A4S2MX02_9PEZI|nr:hypothetical protein EX30DRAFT_267491 [Ascodesmis nigricans]
MYVPDLRPTGGIDTSIRSGSSRCYTYITSSVYDSGNQRRLKEVCYNHGHAGDARSDELLLVWSYGRTTRWLEGLDLDRLIAQMQGSESPTGYGTIEIITRWMGFSFGNRRMQGSGVCDDAGWIARKNRVMPIVTRLAVSADCPGNLSVTGAPAGWRRRSGREWRGGSLLEAESGGCRGRRRVPRSRGLYLTAPIAVFEDRCTGADRDV